MKKMIWTIGWVLVLVLGLVQTALGQEQEKMVLMNKSKVLSSSTSSQQQVIRLTSGTPVRGSCPAHTDTSYKASLCPIDYSIDLPGNATELLVLLQKDGIKDLILAMSFGKTILDSDKFFTSRKIDSSPTKDIEGMVFNEDELKEYGRLPGTWYISVITKERSPQNYTIVALVKTREENKPPIARFTYSPSEPKVGERVRFDASDSSDPDGTIERYRWDFGDGSTDSGSVVYHSFSRKGDYRVTLTVTDNKGATNSTSKTVTVREPENKLPIARFTYSPLKPKVGESVRFDGSGSSDPDGTIERYGWDFGDGSTDSGSVVYHSFSRAGSYRVTLTVTDNRGGKGSTSETITVIAPPVADFTTADPTRGPAPLTVQFTDRSSGEITSYAWDFGDGGTSSEKNPRYTYRNPGIFTVRLTVRGPGGEDTKTRSNYITVIGPPRAPSNLMATTRGQTQIDLSWRDNSDNEEGFEIFRKVQGQSYSPLKKVGTNVTSYSDTGLSPGTTYCYQVRAYNTAGNSDLSNEACATIPPVPAPVADFTADPTRGPAPLTVQFTDRSTGGEITTWRWEFGDGGTSSEKNPSYTYRNPGTFTVKLTVRGPGGESSKTGSIEVLPQIRSFEFEATVEQDKLAMIPLPDSIKNQLPGSGVQYIEMPNTTRRGRTSNLLKDVGLNLNPDTGMIYGTPDKSGKFQFLFEARSDTTVLAEIWAMITITPSGAQPPPPPPPSPGGMLTSGVPQKGTVGAGPKILSDQFTISVLEGTWALLVRLQGTGNVNLHMRLGKPVEIVAGEIVADFSSTSPTGSESISLTGPVQPGMYYIAVENTESSPQTFTILAAVVPVLQLVNSGEPVSGKVEPAPLGGRVLSLTQYVIEVPEGAKSLSAVLENLGLGGMKLHIRYGKPVELSGDRVVADFSSDAPLGVESITIAGAQLRAGKYYIAIENVEPYAQDFKLTVALTR